MSEIIMLLGTMLSALIALISLILGIKEYLIRGSQKRAEYFFSMRKRFSENEKFSEICRLLRKDDVKLREISYDNKLEFLGCLEEVALLVNSKIINPKVAHYMFGYYTIECLESSHFWADEENRDAPSREGLYWELFNDFAVRMKHIEESFSSSKCSLRCSLKF